MLNDQLNGHDVPVRPHLTELDEARAKFEYHAVNAEAVIDRLPGAGQCHSTLALAWSIVYAAMIKRESDF